MIVDEIIIIFIVLEMLYWHFHLFSVLLSTLFGVENAWYDACPANKYPDETWMPHLTNTFKKNKKNMLNDIITAMPHWTMASISAESDQLGE
jgi:hypothetical protein